MRAPKGLEGVIVASTELTKIDGQAGRLIYCGYDATELAGNVSFLLRFWASSKANLATLSDAARVTILIATPTAGAASNSLPEYNPSVVSRTMTMSMLGFSEATLGRLRAGRTLA